MPNDPTPAAAPLAPSEEGYAALVNSLGGIVWEANGRTFQFTFVSPQAEKVLGYPVRQWLDEPNFWQAHTHPDDVGWAGAFCLNATASGRDHEFEYRMIGADGRVVWLRDVVTVICEPSGAIRLRGIMFDVSERKRLEEELRQSQKLEAVGRLAGGVAHDFNNLLTVINGYAELLGTQFPHGHPARATANQIRGAGERAAALTRRLLAFAKRSVISPRPLDLNVLVAGLRGMLGRLIGDDILFATDPAQDLWPVRADPGQIEQVLVNLCVNACDAMPRGGRLTVTTRNIVLTDPTGVGAPAGPHVLLSVADTGAGISPDVLPHIFEPFFTTKGDGTGLGLATVYGVVTQAGGHVTVSSEPDRGTEFRVYLPRCSDEPAPRTDVTTSPLAVGTETILLAEDDDSLRVLGRTILASCGYAVLEAANGRDAVELGRTYGDRIDLLLTDVVMPEMNGREAAEELLRERPGLRVLFVSGYTDDAVVRHGVSEAEVAFLQKPFTPAALAQKVREVLDA